MTLHFRRAWVSVAAAAFFALCCAQTCRLEAPHERGFLPIDPPTPFVRYQAHTTTLGKILVVHGLNSSKEFMQILAEALAEGGFEVYTIDLPGHGDSPVGFEAVAAQTAVNRTLEYLGANTVIGHSLGAGLLLDLATQRPFERMVLLSPPPTPVDAIQAKRMLIVTGDWDMPRINAFIPTLEDLAGSNVEWRRLPWVGHSAAVFSPTHTAAIIRWLDGDVTGLKTRSRLIWIVLQLVSSAVLGISLVRGAPIMPRRTSIKKLVLLYAAAGVGAVIILRFVVVMNWLRIFAMDYLISFLFVSGVLLWTLRVRDRGEMRGEPSPGPSDLSLPEGKSAARRAPGAGFWPRISPYAQAFLSAAFVVFVMGYIGGSHVFHFTLSNGRWWRFPFIAAAAYPLFAIDEVVLRPLYPRWKAAGLGLLTRMLVGTFVTTGALIFNREDAFLVLIIHLVVLFWIGLWFATELIHRNSQNAYAAALFAALVQGWAFAALFVTI